MSLLRKTVLFQRLANKPIEDELPVWSDEQLDAWQKRRKARKDLARQAIEDDEAWAVLMDMLLEDRQIKSADPGEMMNWLIVHNYRAGARKQKVEDMRPGDWVSHSTYSMSPTPVQEIVLEGKRLDYDDLYELKTVRNNKPFRIGHALLVREPPDDWNRNAIVRRVKRMYGIQ